MTWLFFEGDCGFCNSAVRFLARRDPSAGIRFAPLRGASFERLISPTMRAGLPDSLVVLTPEGELLVRIEAVIQLLKRMGRGARLMATLLGWMPRCLGDAVYRLVARYRPLKHGCPANGQGADNRFEP